MDIENILEKVLPIVIVALLIGVAIGYAQQPDYHCPVHGSLDADEVFSVSVKDEVVTFCGYCVLGFLEDSVPELYEVGNEK